MPEGCRRNDRPTARWVSRTRGGRRVTDSTVHDSSIDPRAREVIAPSSVTRASLHRLRDDAVHRIVPSFSPRARARNNRHTTGHDSPSSPLGGASIARARMEGSTVRDDARASVPGARRARARRGERAVVRRGPRARTRGTAVTEIVGGPRPSVEVRRDAVGDSRASALVT